jgi:hypothetical protein
MNGHAWWAPRARTQRAQPSCLAEGTLRAFLDGELVSDEREQVMRHLGSCNACRVRLAEVERHADLARQRLIAVTPTQEVDIRRARAQVQARMRQAGIVPSTSLRRFVMRNMFQSRAWRPALAGVLVLAMLVGVFSFAPSAAVARQLLSVFRVRRFAVIQVSPDQAKMEEIGRSLQDKLFAGEPQVIANEPVRDVPSIEAARQAAGFNVRMPRTTLSTAPAQFSVKGRTELAQSFTRDGLVTLLQMAEMNPNLVPGDFVTGTVRAVAPATVHITLGNTQVIQVNNPSIDYPGGIDPRIIGQAGLRIMGLSAQDAQRISQSIDWTSTVLLPIPANMVEFRELSVAGQEAVLLTTTSQEQRRVLLFQKDNVVYMLMGPITGEDLVQMAESMF